MTAPFAIGLDLGGTGLKVARVARDGTLDRFASFPTAGESVERVFQRIGESLAHLWGSGLVAVGLGCPGRIDPEAGTLVGRTAHLPGWEHAALAERLAGLVKVPVRVDNDANLAALAEVRLGAARGADTALAVTLGAGVGCGIVAGGRIVHGARGGAGEIGHLPIGSGAEPCACGVPGCIEPEISAAGLARAGVRAGLTVSGASDVFALAERGDPVAQRLAAHMTDRLGLCIAIATDLLAPEVVVLAGGGAAAGEPLRARVEAAVRRYVLPSHADVRVLLPAFTQSGVVGAALAAWEHAEAAHTAPDRGLAATGTGFTPPAGG
jgi:glucokinase